MRVLQSNTQRGQRVLHANVQRVTTNQLTQQMKPAYVQRVENQHPARLLRPRQCNTTGTKSPTVFPNGTTVRKRFANGKFHKGVVILYDPVNQYYKIKYRDGASKDFDQQQLHHHHKRTQRYSVQPNLLNPPITPPYHGIPISKQSRHVKPVPPRRQRHTTTSPFMQGYKHVATTLFLHNFAGAGGTIWDETLNKMAAYRDLIKQPDLIVHQ